MAATLYIGFQSPSHRGIAYFNVGGGEKGYQFGG